MLNSCFFTLNRLREASKSHNLHFAQSRGSSQSNNDRRLWKKSSFLEQFVQRIFTYFPRQFFIEDSHISRKLALV
jgi:hypothetical protein